MANYYDEIAEGYSDLHKEEQLKKLKIIKEHLKVKADEKLLDVGCGPGYSQILGGDITGIDPSKELLRYANFKTVCASAENIPFPDKSFDIVISITAIQNFNDITKGLKEIKRVGKDCFVLTALKKSPKIDMIDSEIKNIFKIVKVIEEDKDMIYFIGKRFLY